MIRVQVRPNEALESALRRFKRQCNYAGIFRQAKKYAHHEKRSDKRRREERERIRNIQRAQRKRRARVQPRKSKVKAKSSEEETTDDTAPTGVDISTAASSTAASSTAGSSTTTGASNAGTSPQPAATGGGSETT